MIDINKHHLMCSLQINSMLQFKSKLGIGHNCFKKVKCKGGGVGGVGGVGGGGGEVGTCVPLSKFFTIWGARKGRHIPIMFLIIFLKGGECKWKVCYD
jgi:hypothetical protein